LGQIAGEARIMSKHNNDKGKLPPFVPLLKETLDCPAWRAMSHGARSLYVALKRRYNRDIHNNGRIYLAQRTAAEKLARIPNKSLGGSASWNTMASSS
jgi:hypothetical protein